MSDASLQVTKPATRLHSHPSKSARSKMTGPKAKKSDTKIAQKSQGKTTKAVNTLRKYGFVANSSQFSGVEGYTEVRERQRQKGQSSAVRSGQQHLNLD